MGAKPPPAFKTLLGEVRNLIYELVYASCDVYVLDCHGKNTGVAYPNIKLLEAYEDENTGIPSRALPLLDRQIRRETQYMKFEQQRFIFQNLTSFLITAIRLHDFNLQQPQAIDISVHDRSLSQSPLVLSDCFRHLKRFTNVGSICLSGGERKEHMDRVFQVLQSLFPTIVWTESGGD